MAWAAARPWPRCILLCDSSVAPERTGPLCLCVCVYVCMVMQDPSQHQRRSQRPTIGAKRRWDTANTNSDTHEHTTDPETDTESKSNSNSNFSDADFSETETQSMSLHNGQMGSSRYKRVTWDKTYGKWRARVGRRARSLHVGYYACEKEAALAQDAAAYMLYGR